MRFDAGPRDAAAPWSECVMPMTSCPAAMKSGRMGDPIKAGRAGKKDSRWQPTVSWLQMLRRKAGSQKP